MKHFVWLGILCSIAVSAPALAQGSSSTGGSLVPTEVMCVFGQRPNYYVFQVSPAPFEMSDGGRPRTNGVVFRGVTADGSGEWPLRVARRYLDDVAGHPVVQYFTEDRSRLSVLIYPESWATAAEIKALPQPSIVPNSVHYRAWLSFGSARVAKLAGLCTYFGAP